jgi:thymidylate synthase (FAD)
MGSMIVTLKHHTVDPEATIGEDAAICYGSDTSREANIRRAKGCKDKGHLATLRFAYATFHINGISRVCSHQLVRMAHAGILQRSQRYCKESVVTYVTPPGVAALHPDYQREWQCILDAASNLYTDLVESKVMHQQEARYILPQAITTQVNICLNFQGYKDLLKNRATKAADWEVRAVAFEIQRQLHEIAPNLF